MTDTKPDTEPGTPAPDDPEMFPNEDAAPGTEPKADEATKPDEAPKTEKPRRGRPPGSKNKAPAKKKTAAKKADEIPVPSVSKIEGLIAGIPIVLTVGIVVSPRLAYDADIIAANSKDIAKEIHKLAKNHPPVAKALNRIMKSSDYAGLVALALGVVVPIAANHGLLPVGVVALLPGDTPVPAPRPQQAIITTDDRDAASDEPQTSPGLASMFGLGEHPAGPPASTGVDKS